MLWLVIEDHYLFSDIDALNKALKNNKLNITITKNQLVPIPSLQTINKLLLSDNKEQKVIIDYSSPVEKIGQDSPIFVVKYIKSDSFPFKQLHTILGISKSEVLSSRLALTISEPKVTLDDLAGAESLHLDIEKMRRLESMRIRTISGLFLFGVPGAGKSFFAECFAGSTNRLFAELDLAHFMTLPNPTRSIDNLFEFLLSQNEKYLLLIDEIEKMFQFDGSSNHLVSEQVFGKMLTWLAKLYGMKDSNLTFVATANRVEKLLINKPEFVRKGRFNRLYFLHYPSKNKSARDIFALYFKKEADHIVESLNYEYNKYNNGEKISDSLNNFFMLIKSSNLQHDEIFNAIVFRDFFNIERIIKVIDGTFQSYKITKADYFIYTPPEIHSLVGDILDYYMDEILQKLESGEINIKSVYNKEFDVTPIETVLDEHILFNNPPMQVTASEGIRIQIAQGSNIKQGDKIAPFIEIS